MENFIGILVIDLLYLFTSLSPANKMKFANRLISVLCQCSDNSKLACSLASIYDDFIS